LKEGAPRENAVAQIGYHADAKNWSFRIDDFVRIFEDDC